MNVQPIAAQDRRAVDLVLHINEELDSDRRTVVEQTLSTRQGICGARFHPTRTHLMVVGYDPKEINSTAILDIVTRQQLEAQLVGGL